MGAANTHDETNEIETLEVADRTCWDVMTTALEGGIGYWASARKILRHADDGTPDAFSIVSCEIREDGIDGDDPGDWLPLNADVIRKGIALLFDRQVCPEYLAESFVAETDADGGCAVDADAADAIVQLATLGCIVYC